MAEIKVLEPIKAEITAMNSAVSVIDIVKHLANAPDMQCAKKYALQQEEIRKLIMLYQQLVEKDVKEIASIVGNFFTIDESMGGR